MRCYRIFEDGKFGRGKVTEMDLLDLTEGNVQIEVHHSSINYKDALAGLGKGKILKSYPLNGGIDCAGVVVSSSDSRFLKGDKVLVNGSTLSEWSDGGYGEFINVKSDWVVPLPKGLTLFESMALGTAGFTAALCLHRMLKNGQTPEKGPILVTGASGGVGLIAIQLLSQNGFEVIAMTGKTDLKETLKSFGASEVKSFDELKLGVRPLEKARFGGAIDNVGGEVLSRILPHIHLWGNVASVGMALDANFKTTVMPFILRGVSLLGASSNNCENSVRQEIWKRLGEEWKPEKLSELVQSTVGLEGLDLAFEKLIERRSWGRTVVDCRK